MGRRHQALAQAPQEKRPAETLATVEWRQWVMQTFEQYPERNFGNEGINFVAGIYVFFALNFFFAHSST